MHEIPFQRFAGARAAYGSFGAPSLAGWRVPRQVVLVAIVLGLVAMLYASGLIDGHALVTLAPVVALPVGASAGGRAVDLREQALAKFLEAKALEDADGTIKAEDSDRYNAIVEEAIALDKEAAKASTAADNAGTVRERLEFYQGKATGQPMHFRSTELDPSGPKSLGQQFVDSAAYKDVLASGALNSPDKRFNSSPVILGVPPRVRGAAGDVIQTEDGGPAGDGLVRTFRIPGIQQLAQRPLTVRALFPNENMPSGDTIEYAAQTGFDRASGLAVKQSTTTSDAEGLKKQSSLAWQIATARAEWIATYFVTTRQALADVDQVRAAIDNQGRLMLQLEEEDMLIGGSGTPPEIAGILGGGVTGVQTLDLTGEDNLDGIRTARRLVQTGLSRLRPDFVVVNPVDGEEFDLLKDDFGQYRGGNPIGNFDFDQSIWRLRRVESEAVSEGHALVGAGAGATVYERQPITVTTADQHADFFVRNLVVILFEERLAFPVYFPTAFVDVTLADWTPGSGS